MNKKQRIIRKVYMNKSNNQRIVSIPMKSNIHAGNFVEIILLKDKENETKLKENKQTNKQTKWT